MEHELETNNIKEKLINWRNKAFNLKERYLDYNHKINSLNKLPEKISDIYNIFYLLAFFGNAYFNIQIVDFMRNALHWNYNNVGLFGLAELLIVTLYLAYEVFTEKTKYKVTKWYLKKINSENKQIPLKNELEKTQEEINTLFSNKEMLEILDSYKPKLNTMNSMMFYKELINFQESQNKDSSHACVSLGQTLNYLIENEHLFEDKNKLIKYL